MGASVPTRSCSSKKSVPPICQLRPTFARRRRTDYRQPQLRREARSPEEGTSSYKVCLRRSRRTYNIATSDEPSFVGGQSPHPLLAPANNRPQEESGLPKIQLRRWKGAHRRKAPNQKKNRESSDYSVLRIHIHIPIKLLYHPHPPTLPVSSPARVFSPPNFP